MLNWLTRYAFVNAELGFDEHGGLTESVLDVGCGPHGLSTSAPGAVFAGVDLLFPEPTAPGMIAFRNEPGALPFEDGAFDTVVCLDVLEHVPPGDRAGFVGELARVAARRVLLACPSDEGGWIDDLLRETYAGRGIEIPVWLSEHEQHGLPTAEEIARFCAAPDGFTARELTMTNGLLSTLAVIADMLPEYAGRAGAEFRDNREGWLETFAAGRFGSCHRKGYAIERDEPVLARARAADLRDSVWGAVRCPACGRAELTPAAASGAVCSACAHRLGRESTGAFDLSAPAPRPRALAPVRSTAGTRLLLRPDWAVPESWLPAVARYVALSEPERDYVLCVDAVGSPLGLHTIHEMLSLACEAVGGGRPGGDIILLDEPYEPAGLAPIETAAELGATLGLPSVARVVEAAQVADHAKAAKRLCDHLRGIAERRLYELAGDPWAGPEPLVTVRIATWKGHRTLVERSIPSVLSGSYRNVEVIVCSDGPDPEARAAVQAIADPRVRYTELAERPVYPAQPWSFWETAGIYAVHHALDHARGDFIAPLDHDDAFTDDHLHVLLAAARSTGADLVYGQALMQEAGGRWWTCGSEPLAHGQIAHGTVLYSSRLRHVRLDPHCWLHDEPGDWNMWRRISELGAGICFVPRVVLAHFQERKSIDAEAGSDSSHRWMRRRPEEIAADLERCGLDWLLDVPLALSAAAA